MAPTVIAAPRQLSPREASVFALLCEGMTQKQIAAELHVSVRRIEEVVADMKTKCGVTSVAALVARMLERTA